MMSSNLDDDDDDDDDEDGEEEDDGDGEEEEEIEEDEDDGAGRDEDEDAGFVNAGISSSRLDFLSSLVGVFASVEKLVVSSLFVSSTSFDFSSSSSSTITSANIDCGPEFLLSLGEGFG